MTTTQTATPEPFVEAHKWCIDIMPNEEGDDEGLIGCEIPDHCQWWTAPSPAWAWFPKAEGQVRALLEERDRLRAALLMLVPTRENCPFEGHQHACPIHDAALSGPEEGEPA